MPIRNAGVTSGGFTHLATVTDPASLFLGKSPWIISKQISIAVFHRTFITKPSGPLIVVCLTIETAII